MPSACAFRMRLLHAPCAGTSYVFKIAARYIALYDNPRKVCALTVVFWGVSASRALPNLCRYHTVPTDTPRYKKCILMRDYYSRIEIGSTMVQYNKCVFSASFLRQIQRPRSQQPPAIVKIDDIGSCLWPLIGRHIIVSSERRRAKP